MVVATLDTWVVFMPKIYPITTGLILIEMCAIKVGKAVAIGGKVLMVCFWMPVLSFTVEAGRNPIGNWPKALWRRALKCFWQEV